MRGIQWFTPASRERAPAAATARPAAVSQIFRQPGRGGGAAPVLPPPGPPRARADAGPTAAPPGCGLPTGTADHHKGGRTGPGLPCTPHSFFPGLPSPRCVIMPISAHTLCICRGRRAHTTVNSPHPTDSGLSQRPPGVSGNRPVRAAHCRRQPPALLMTRSIGDPVVDRIMASPAFRALAYLTQHFPRQISVSGANLLF